jgi:hypothetical protein
MFKIQNCYRSFLLKQAAIEESNREIVSLVNSNPSMLLSYSLEPDLSHTSILYCCNMIHDSDILALETSS